jgi:hypothetical protein
MVAPDAIPACTLINSGVLLSPLDMMAGLWDEILQFLGVCVLERSCASQRRAQPALSDF